jgi:hypothetical protein
MDNKDMPAMPQSGDNIELWNDPTNPKAGTYFATGLTKREHFAGLAMQGLLANSGGVIQSNSQSGFGWCNCDDSQLAELSATCADALLAALDKASK